MTRKTRSQPSVARGKCPQCATINTVGLVRQGEHLVWRNHTRTLGSGARLECPAVGVPICQVGPVPIKGVTTPVCPCGAAA